jgi:hypothetical protein
LVFTVFHSPDSLDLPSEYLLLRHVLRNILKNWRHFLRPGLPLLRHPVEPDLEGFAHRHGASKPLIAVNEGSLRDEATKNNIADLLIGEANGPQPVNWPGHRGRIS